MPLEFSIVPRRFYKTHSNHKACIYRTDGAGEFKIHGAVLQSDGWVICIWNDEGISQKFHNLDGITGLWEEREIKGGLDPQCSRGMNKEMFEDMLGKKWIRRLDDPTRYKFKAWLDPDDETVNNFEAVTSVGKLVRNLYQDGHWYTLKKAEEIIRA